MHSIISFHILTYFYDKAVIYHQILLKCYIFKYFVLTYPLILSYFVILSFPFDKAIIRYKSLRKCNDFSVFLTCMLIHSTISFDILTYFYDKAVI